MYSIHIIRHIVSLHRSYQKNLLLSFIPESYCMMFMGTYILNVRIALTLKAISILRVFFSSLTSFFFFFFHCFFSLPTFSVHCTEFAMQFSMAFIRYATKEKFQNEWNGVAHISLFHSFTGLTIHTHTQSLLANRKQFVILLEYKFSSLTTEPKTSNNLFIYEIKKKITRNAHLFVWYFLGTVYCA